MGVLVLLAGVGLLLVATGVLGATDRLPRNRFVGIRVRSTLRSDEAWRAGHRAAAVPFVVGGILVLACAAVGVWIAAFVPLGVLVGLMATLWAAWRAIGAQRDTP